MMITERLFDTRVDLPVDARAGMIELLNQQLADTFDLFSQAKQAHWNVRGAQFFQLHELFDRLAAELNGHVDLIAERVTALGGVAMGTVRMSSRHSRLAECDVAIADSLPVIESLAVRFGALATNTRHAIQTAEDHGDGGTADLLTEVSRALDKGLWFLEAHRQR